MSAPRRRWPEATHEHTNQTASQSQHHNEQLTGRQKTLAIESSKAETNLKDMRQDKAKTIPNKTGRRTNKTKKNNKHRIE